MYKKPFTYEKAMAINTEGVGKHFDPTIVETFTHISEKRFSERTGLDQFGSEASIDLDSNAPKS